MAININKFILKDVHCFAGEQSFDIRPLTFLVGENSTGKSTALGCFHVLHNLVYPSRDNSLDFNIEPYQMGAFVDIARTKKQEFELAFKLKELENHVHYRLTFVERDQGSEPVISQAKLIFPEHGELLFLPSDKSSRRLKIEKSGDGKFTIHSVSITLSELFYFVVEIDDLLSRRGKEKLTPDEKACIRFCKKIKGAERFNGKRSSSMWSYFGFYRDFSPVYSFAPIRSKPLRTYNPLAENENPEGSDVPMFLMNIFEKNKDKWEQLRKQLISFGESSGLFTDIAVKKHGKSMSNPFQLQIKVQGKKANLVDVGYGISQILPILVRIFNAGRGTKFLLQQPEVHLHPKGQAELNSLLISLIKEKKQSYIIETHSDYMIDRTRIEIMQGKISPDDVSLVYLEPVGNAVKVHNVTFDKLGNFIGLPSSYNHFFLKEAHKLMGAED